MFRNLKYRMAFFFGRLEHRFSRILFIELCITYLIFLYGNVQWLKYLLPIALGLWIIYWLSHSAEKWSFKHNQR